MELLNALKMDIWLTEWGYSTHFDDGKHHGYTVGAQSKYIARRMVEIASLPDVTISTMYQYIDDFVDPRYSEANFGIVYYGGSYPKPSYYVVQRIDDL